MSDLEKSLEEQVVDVRSVVESFFETKSGFFKSEIWATAFSEKYMHISSPQEVQYLYKRIQNNKLAGERKLFHEELKQIKRRLLILTRVDIAQDVLNFYKSWNKDEWKFNDLRKFSGDGIHRFFQRTLKMSAKDGVKLFLKTHLSFFLQNMSFSDFLSFYDSFSYSLNEKKLEKGEAKFILKALFLSNSLDSIDSLSKMKIGNMSGDLIIKYLRKEIVSNTEILETFSGTKYEAQIRKFFSKEWDNSFERALLNIYKKNRLFAKNSAKVFTPNNKPIEDFSHGRGIEDVDAESPEDLLIKEDEINILKQIAQKLNFEEREVLFKYFDMPDLRL